MAGLIEILAAAMGLAGSLLLALRLRWSPLGWVAFLLSNAGWLVFAWGNGHWGLFVQQCGFTLTSCMGIWRWVVQPWIEERADVLLDRTIGGL